MSSATGYESVARLGFGRAAQLWFPPGSTTAAVAWLRALALLALVGASIGLFVGTLVNDFSLQSFLASNSLDRTVRRALLFSLFGGGFVGALVGVAASFKRKAGILWAQWLADLAAPLGAALALPSLFSARTWHGQPLTYLFQLAVVVVYLEWAFGRGLAALKGLGFGSDKISVTLPTRLSKALPLLTVLAAAAAYTAYFSYYTILNHHQLGTTGYDLGIIVNWAHNGLHGDFDRCTVLYAYGNSCFGGHAIYAMVLWLPFYVFGPGAEPLLIFQALMLGGAAVPLYLFASTQIGRWSAVVVAFAYLMFPPLHGPNFYDFHGLPLTLPFYFWLFYAIAVRKPWQIAAAVLFLFAHREDIAVGVTILGVFLAVTGVRLRLGLLLSALGCTWFVLNKFMLMPLYGESTWFANIYKDLQPAGEATYGGVVKTILSNPPYFLGSLLKEEKAVYFLHMLTPLVFLPLRKPAFLLFLLPGFFFTIMTTGYAPTISISFQYTTHWIPYIFLASVLCLRLIADKSQLRKRAALSALAFGMLCHSYVFGAVLQHDTFVGGFGPISFEFNEKERERYEALQSLLERIPPEASVAATEDVIAHAASRQNAYTLRTDYASADFLLIRRQGLGFSNTRAVLRDAFSTEDYGLVAESHDIYLFGRGVESDKTAAALKKLGIHVSKHKVKKQENGG